VSGTRILCIMHVRVHMVSYLGLLLSTASSNGNSKLKYIFLYEKKIENVDFETIEFVARWV
jgi:hypothetical protein